MNIVKSLLKEALTEAYNAVDEINELTNDIINYYAENNYPMISRINRLGIGEDTIHFNQEFMEITSDTIDVNKYRVLKNLINSGKLKIFLGRIKSNGLFSPENFTISVNMYTQKFVDNLHYQMQSIERNDINRIESNNAIMVLKVAIGMTFRGSFLHELRHAYDEFTSNGRYVTDKKSSKYYGKYDTDSRKKDYTMSPEQYKIYLTLPHEYWARFTQTINGLNKLLPFDKYFNEFKRKVGGWDLISPNNQKRLSKAVYTYWHLKPAVNEISVKHKGQYNAGQEHIIYPARNKNMLIKVGPINIVDTWLPLFEKYPNIFPKVYKSGFTIKNGEKFKYVVLEKLDTDKVQAQWDLINDALNEIGENDEDYLEYCFDDMAMTFLKSLLNPEYHTAISTMLQQFKPNEFESYMKWFNFISEVNKLVRQIKNVDAMDVYDGNFGYDSTGKIKCLDI